MSATAAELRAKAQKLLDEAAEIERTAAEFRKLHRVQVVCGPCNGRGFFTNGGAFHGTERVDCGSCEGRGWHPALRFAGPLEHRFSKQEDYQQMTMGWDQ